MGSMPCASVSRCCSPRWLRKRASRKASFGEAECTGTAHRCTSSKEKLLPGRAGSPLLSSRDEPCGIVAQEMSEAPTIPGSASRRAPPWTQSESA